MGYEWDEEKNRRNLVKHGISFVAASRIFHGPVVEKPDDRRDYGEQRVVAYGIADGRVLAVVYTPRGRNRRIISARRARSDEREAYHRRHPRHAP